MDSNIEISLLLDFYGSMLTDKQQDIANLYYNGDYSLSEIADDLHISRQGVRDSLKRAEIQLRLYEEKIGIIKKTAEFEKKIKEIQDIAESALANKNSDVLHSAIEKIYEKAHNFGQN